MGNPTGVTAGDSATESWADDVVSRVVGIYASTAAAESDGRTEAGALIMLTNGTAWVKMSATAGDWAFLSPLVERDLAGTVTPSASTYTQHGSDITIDAGTARQVWVDVDYRARVNPGTTADVQVRIRVSFDNGASWSTSYVMRQDGIADYSIIGHDYMPAASKPTNDIVVRVEVWSNQSDTVFENGLVVAKVFPKMPVT